LRKSVVVLLLLPVLVLSVNGPFLLFSMSGRLIGTGFVSFDPEFVYFRRFLPDISPFLAF
jgi:hypothetical protein